MAERSSGARPSSENVVSMCLLLQPGRGLASEDNGPALSVARASLKIERREAADSGGLHVQTWAPKGKRRKAGREASIDREIRKWDFDTSRHEVL